MITIRKITSEETYAIRLETLRKGIDLPVQFSGDLDIDTFHLGAFYKNELVGISSYMKSNNSDFNKQQYQLRGMATLPEVRGKGCGKLMLEFAIDELGKRKVNTLWCNAREIAFNFYTNLGFTVKGNPFELSLIGKHYLLYKEL
jgi:GNAT superfamily N-acetyltransferase